MPDQNESLGGRIPLFDPHKLKTEQKSVYDSWSRTWCRGRRTPALPPCSMTEG